MPLPSRFAERNLEAHQGAGEGRAVQRSIEGRKHVRHLDARPLHAGMERIWHYVTFWQQRLDVLESLLVEEDRASANEERGKRGAGPNDDSDET